MKYILVTGGVISGIGKGVISSSLGTIIKEHGLTPTSIKIDPYLNIDAGTFSPYEHGEVYVLDDGGEVDLDLGNYERFLDVKLSRDNNITTGKVYRRVIEKERRGDYLGKTVQVVPHLCNEIQDWVEKVAATPDENGVVADVCVIELGGTIGDIESMPFVEAFRQFQFRVGPENFILVHVSLIPQPSSTGEQKTKPTQHSIRELRGLGLVPNFIVCRSKQPLQSGISTKVAMFCHVHEDHVIAVPDVDSIYRVPLVLKEQGLVKLIWNHLKLPESTVERPLEKWRNLADRYAYSRDSVRICLVGKYTALSDAYHSVIAALEHSALYIGYKLDLVFVEASKLENHKNAQGSASFHEAWHKLCGCDGLLVPGGFGERGTEGKIAAIHWARTKKIPFFGICLGLQLAVVEFCRNVLGWEDANSSELNPDSKHQVVIDMPEHNQGQMGGTMRLGKRTTEFVDKDCIARKLYGDVDAVDERHRHRYEVNPEYIADIQAKGLKFVGQDVDHNRMEVAELHDGSDHPFYLSVQYHPEFLSRPLKPSPPFLGFVLASCGKLEEYLSTGLVQPLGFDNGTPPISRPSSRAQSVDATPIKKQSQNNSKKTSPTNTSPSTTNTAATASSKKKLFTDGKSAELV